MAGFCPICGRAALPEAAFCVSCGHRLPEILAKQPDHAGVEKATPTRGQDVPAEPALAADVVSQVEPSEVPSRADLAETARVTDVPASEPGVRVGGAPANASREPAAARRRLAFRLGTGLVAIAVVALAAYGFVTTQALEQTRATLASTEEDLALARSTLVESNASLAAEQELRKKAELEGASLRNRIAVLEDQVAGRNACVAALQRDADELAKITREQAANFNRLAEDSPLAEAQVAYQDALRDQINAYYNAYAAAWDGRYSSANSWIDRGNAAGRRASAALKTYNAQIKTINAGTAKIDREMTALQENIAATVAMCDGADST